MLSELIAPTLVTVLLLAVIGVFVWAAVAFIRSRRA